MKLALLFLLVSAAAAFTSVPRSRSDASIASLKMSSIGTTYSSDHHFDARDYNRRHDVYQQQHSTTAWNSREVYQHRQYSPSGHRVDGSWNHDFDQAPKSNIPHRQPYSGRDQRQTYSGRDQRQTYSGRDPRQTYSAQDWMRRHDSERQRGHFSSRFNPHHLVDDYQRWSNRYFDPQPESPYKYYMGFNPGWQDPLNSHEDYNNQFYSPPPPRDHTKRDQQRDVYQILEVSPHASLNEIKKAYQKLAKLYHPDSDHCVLVDGTEDECEDTKEKFQEINSAYHILKEGAVHA